MNWLLRIKCRLGWHAVAEHRRYTDDDEWTEVHRCIDCGLVTYAASST
ncbi:hypothetical protein SEA_ZITCH_77 [Gordonia Phage Zitch]|uniref:Uncharacterized protein n=3 Tax=Zitchvirus TaxID=2948963 RepID=A0A514DHY6_9CAUD|nr:hypothetical protein J1774_gp77 [Gordonia Phage Zitch]YP_010002825.1 hypothetical protein J1775_gp76 [Gordonia phage Zipp]QDH93229.1 hypothetical protein SEA_ZIPP_76 [Gordonia phage Zipp]QKY78522.1 hypothetical protein SEA_ZITCH_77 [Gordonia Phage Zitch]UVG35037.1 hypothetical protein SEA_VIACONLECTUS_75 [Gordonia phage ViaConlectus]